MKPLVLGLSLVIVTGCRGPSLYLYSPYDGIVVEPETKLEVLAWVDTYDHDLCAKDVSIQVVHGATVVPFGSRCPAEDASRPLDTADDSGGESLDEGSGVPCPSSGDSAWLDGEFLRADLCTHVEPTRIQLRIRDLRANALTQTDGAVVTYSITGIEAGDTDTGPADTDTGPSDTDTGSADTGDTGDTSDSSPIQETADTGDSATAGR